MHCYSRWFLLEFFFVFFFNGDSIQVDWIFKCGSSIKLYFWRLRHFTIKQPFSQQVTDWKCISSTSIIHSLNRYFPLNYSLFRRHPSTNSDSFMEIYCYHHSKQTLWSPTACTFNLRFRPYYLLLSRREINGCIFDTVPLCYLQLEISRNVQFTLKYSVT